MTAKRTVLIVEDDQYLASEISFRLTCEGHSTLITKLPAKAKRLLGEQHVDAAILDVALPGGRSAADRRSARGWYRSGMLLAAWIKQNYPTLPFVAYSWVEDREICDWFNQNSRGFFSKSVRPKLLVEKVMRILGQPGVDEPRAFVVHGHDENAKYELKNYLQNTLHFSEPCILCERASYGRTIMEKFEQEGADTDVVFVLLTPDDKAAALASSEDEKLRARQNVIFEMGYFLGRLGREGKKVILLHKGPLELPSDIQGVEYIDISNGIEAAGERIRREIPHLF